MNEEPMTLEQIAKAEADARKMLVEGHALAGLIEAECQEPTLFLPLITKGLRCVHTGDGDLRVLSVDERGEIRNGPRGPMSATDLARELASDEGFREIGWQK